MARTKKKQEKSLIQVRDLLIEFGTGRKRVKAVKGVTFDVYQGETFGLVGESGSGKTTIARAIMGMQHVSDGAIYFNDRLARGKQPNLFGLSEALQRNADILVENQISTTEKLNDFIEEYRRIYYKYLESSYYDFKTKEVIAYKDGIDRHIAEGTNLKNTKIVNADKENSLKQVYVMVKDSLKRLVKIVRILQKTMQFTNHLSDYINIDKELDQTITLYLNNIKVKILEVKDYENQIYFALQDARKLRSDVKEGKITSVSKYFDQMGNDIKVMVENHKNISIVLKTIDEDIYIVQALLSPTNKRLNYVKEINEEIGNIKTEIEQNSNIYNDRTLSKLENILNLLQLTNINDAIVASNLFTKPNKADKKHLKKEMQMIFQDPASSLNDRMPVEEIIGEGLNNFPEIYKNEATIAEYAQWYNADKPAEAQIGLNNITNKQLKHYLILKQLENVGLLPEHLSRYPHEFSGGQRQRIGIARALIMNPQFIVADEPISALDVSIRAQVLNLLKHFQKESNLTYVFIAHDLSVVRHIADRIAVIYRGDIVELAEADELFNNPIHPYTRSLLSAIPLADPEQEAKKIHLNYDPEVEHPDYLSDFPVWQEIKPGHFVYANKREAKKYEAEFLNAPKKVVTKKTSKKVTTKKKTTKTTSKKVATKKPTKSRKKVTK